MIEGASLYHCRIMHERRLPFLHRFTYRVFSLLLDIDRIPEISAKSRVFAHDRFGLISFFNRDHGPRDGSALRPWVEAALASAGHPEAAARIELLCFPRILGYAFNPLSVYFCYAADDRLAAILYEVKNTFGDQHGYLIAAQTDAVARDHRAEKIFHVSPFLPDDGHYRFRILPPGDRIALAIRHFGPEGLRLVATQTGKRHPFTDRSLLKAFLLHPLMTLKVISAIHWEAFFIWRKGAAFYRRPEPPQTPISHAG